MYEWLRWTDVTFTLVVILAFAFAFTKCLRHQAVRSAKRHHRVVAGDIHKGSFGRELDGTRAILSPKDLWE
jgi:hypothetical protein